MVLQQLQYTGMLETIRIRREGFSVRMPFEDAIGAYRGAVFEFHKVLHPTKQNVAKLLEACEAKQLQINEANGVVRNHLPARACVLALQLPCVLTG